MCTTKPRIAVRVTTVVAGSVIVLFAETGQAEGFTRVVNDTSDAQAENLGAVFELKLLAGGPGETGDEPSREEVQVFLTRSFRRLAPAGALLVELRDVAPHEDGEGFYWTSTALWVHGSVAPAAAAASSQQDA